MGFSPKSSDDKAFVEDLWARRKVGFLLDQIRQNGEKKELVDEVTALAKKYGIATPYTSYLVVPDSVAPVAGAPPAGRPVPLPGPAPKPLALQPGFGQAGPGSVAGLARELDKAKGDGKGGEGIGGFRGKLEDDRAAKAAAPSSAPVPAEEARALKDAAERKEMLQKAQDALRRRDQNAVRVEKLGVELSIQMNNLRNQDRLEPTAQKRVAGRNCIDVGGVWIDEGFTAKTPHIVVKAMSEAYFKLLEKQPPLKEVFKLGNYLIYITPSGTALMIDAGEGKETLTDAEIAQLFVKK
jgi:Ca-activated chloride channel family protein